MCKPYMKNDNFDQKSVFFSKNQKSAIDSLLKIAFFRPKRSFELKIPYINTKSTIFSEIPTPYIYRSFTIYVKLQENL